MKQIYLTKKMAYNFHKGLVKEFRIPEKFEIGERIYITEDFFLNHNKDVTVIDPVNGETILHSHRQYIESGSVYNIFYNADYQFLPKDIASFDMTKNIPRYSIQITHIDQQRLFDVTNADAFTSGFQDRYEGLWFNYEDEEYNCIAANGSFQTHYRKFHSGTRPENNYLDDPVLWVYRFKVYEEK